MCKYSIIVFQYTVECFCGNSFSATKKGDGECNHRCPGDNSKWCGGTWRISVYSADGELNLSTRTTRWPKCRSVICVDECLYWFIEYYNCGYLIQSHHGKDNLNAATVFLKICRGHDSVNDLRCRFSLELNAVYTVTDLESCWEHTFFSKYAMTVNRSGIGKKRTSRKQYWQDKTCAIS